MKNMLRIPAGLLCATATLALTACGSADIGSVPDDVVDLYDMGSPDGVMEIEIDRSGNVREMEADIPVDALPARVRRVAMERAPGGHIYGAEREIHPEGRFWEVKLTHEGRKWEIIMDDDGELIETEKELRRNEAPAAVLRAGDMAVAGGVFLSVEEVKKGDMTEYHIKKKLNGASYKIVLEPDGSVKRTVREARAELEIPLKH